MRVGANDCPMNDDCMIDKLFCVQSRSSEFILSYLSAASPFTALVCKAPKQRPTWLSEYTDQALVISVGRMLLLQSVQQALTEM